MRTGCLECMDPEVDNKLIAKQVASCVCCMCCVCCVCVCVCVRERERERERCVQLVDMIVQVDKRQGSLSIKHLAIPTVTSSLKWHEQDIFKRPGIRTPEGEFYHSPGETDVAKYGYRVGTAEEVCGRVCLCQFSFERFTQKSKVLVFE